MRRRATQWPPRNEKASDRQGKISHLLRIILDNSTTLNDFERMFVDKMGALLNRRTGIEPATALSEKQARTLRKIIFKRHRDYNHAVPPLPAGVKFEDEVRRLLKSQPNPNEARNATIQKAKALLDQYLGEWAERNEWWDGEQKIGRTKYKGIEGDVITFEVEMIVSEGGKYTSTYEVNVDTNEVHPTGGNYTY
jgi:hypothetical protein